MQLLCKWSDLQGKCGTGKKENVASENVKIYLLSSWNKVTIMGSKNAIVWDIFVIARYKAKLWEKKSQLQDINSYCEKLIYCLR